MTSYLSLHRYEEEAFFHQRMFSNDNEVQLRVAKKRAVCVILRGPKDSLLVVVDREPQCNPTSTTSLAGLNWAYVLKLSLFKTLR